MFNWNEASETMLRGCLKDGLSYGQTAEKLSKAFGQEVSSGAVIGKAQRLGISQTAIRKAAIAKAEKSASKPPRPAGKVSMVRPKTEVALPKVNPSLKVRRREMKDGEERLEEAQERLYAAGYTSEFVASYRSLVVKRDGAAVVQLHVQALVGDDPPVWVVMRKGIDLLVK